MKRVIKFYGCPDSTKLILRDIVNGDFYLKHLSEQCDTTLGCEDCWEENPCNKPAKYKLTLTLERTK